jgi:uncharacterized protein YqhQ
MSRLTPPCSLPRLRGSIIRITRVVLGAQQAAIGGQAVMEGVMMRSPNHWAVALRRGDGSIVEVHRQHTSLSRRHAWARIPILRGSIALYESMRIGFKALSVSAHFAAEADAPAIKAYESAYEAARSSGATRRAARRDANEAARAVAERKNDPAMPDADASPGASGDAMTRGASVVHVHETEEEGNEANPDSISGWQIAMAFVLAFGFAIALFKVAPVFLTKWVGVGGKSFSFVAIESVIRIGIFIGYLALVGLMSDMRRVFQYHSAEHKAINGWEQGAALEPVVVNAQSRIHVRCGTAFMLWVFVVAIFVFGLYGYLFDPGMAELVASRVVLLPLIAGVSFELIRFAGKHPNNPVLRGVLAPGLWMQYLTTRPCTEEQCEVAIASLRAVLDREYPDSSAEQALSELTNGPDEAAQVMA